MALRLITLWSRLYITVLAMGIAAIGAKSAIVAFMIVLAALAIDLWRNFNCPEFVVKPDEIARRFCLRSQDDDGFKTLARRHNALRWITLGALLGYVIVLIGLHQWLGSEKLAAILRPLQFLTDIVSPIWPMIERHAIDLDSRALHDRVSLVTHVYSAVFLFMILATVVALVTQSTYLGSRAVRSMIEKRKVFSHSSALWRALFSLAIGFGEYLWVGSFEEITELSESRYAFPIHNYDYPLVIYAFLMMGMFLMFLYAYVWLLAAMIIAKPNATLADRAAASRGL